MNIEHGKKYFAHSYDNERKKSDKQPPKPGTEREYSDFPLDEEDLPDLIEPEDSWDRE